MTCSLANELLPVWEAFFRSYFRQNDRMIISAPWALRLKTVIECCGNDVCWAINHIMADKDHTIRLKAGGGGGVVRFSLITLNNLSDTCKYDNHGSKLC